METPPPIDDVSMLFGATQIATPSKMDVMNPTDANLIRALVTNTDLIERFEHQIALYHKLDRKPEDTLRRFSLNGDNKLDFKEFHPALKRLFGHDITHAQSKELFLAFCPSSGKKLDIDQFCQIMSHWVQVAQRMHGQKYTSSSSLDLMHPSSVPVVDNNGNIRRGLELATKHYDKLNEIFLKMDVGCTGYLTNEEFELAMSHLGVYLNGQEYERLYAQLPDNVRTAHGVQYASFLSMLGVKMSCLFQNQKLWDKMLAHGDLLRKYLMHYQKQGKSSMPPEHFRDLLSHCGIMLSNGDFTGLRLRMQEYQDLDGYIKLPDFLAALNDKTKFLANSTGLVGCNGPPSPLKRGKKKVEPHELSNAAGKSTEQRNAEAHLCRVKAPEHTKQAPKFADLYMQNVHPPHEEKNPNSLENRILAKIQQYRDLGYTQCTSLKGLFPGDRFGKITRGQFRQSLAQLSLVTRHAEVEALFWKLDPAGRGFISVHEFHNHLNKYLETPIVAKPLLSSEGPNQTDRQQHIDEIKLFDALREKIHDVIRICKTLDPPSTGCVSRGDFIWAMQEAGIILSQSDATAAIALFSERKDGVVVYQSILDRLDGTRRPLPHLSNTSVLLDQTNTNSPDNDQQPVKPKTDYPARRSNLQLGYGYDEPGIQEPERDLTYALQSNTTLHHPLSEVEKNERVLRQRHARRVLLIQNILERRSDLKMCFDLMPYRHTSNGAVLLSLDEIIDIFNCARMNLPLQTPDEARSFLREIVPPNLEQLSFVELIRILTMAQRMEVEPEDAVRQPVRDVLSPSTCEVSIRAKLLQYSTLRDVSVMQWNTTGAIIVRHAFKGLSRDTLPSSSTGSFDALCRNADLKHICFRLALDLNPSELAFLTAKLDVEKKGFFSSTSLFQCFTQLLYAL